MKRSILEAIEMGIWDYEPESTNQEEYDSTEALPGTDEKLTVIAHRLRSGLPLWHPSDRRCFDESDVE